jgi:hypothetical protein
LGTSRRYAHHYDQRMDEKILERVMADSAPSSLGDEELELDVQPLTKPPRAVTVTALVRYGSGQTAVRVEGRAVAWDGQGRGGGVEDIGGEGASGVGVGFCG